jgi:8-oxo-dGTP diphosphatase
LTSPLTHPHIPGMTPSGILDELDGRIGELRNYRSDDDAVLMFIQRGGTGTDGEVLLIEKKRGLGAGKINGPGGKLENGESFEEAAIRECQEEVGLTPIDPRLMGRLYFTFADGYRMYGEVFWAWKHSGTEVETDEAKPFWCAPADMPYARMWADDRLWMPQVLLGHRFSAYFFFDGDALLHAQIQYDFSSGLPAHPAGNQRDT